MKKVILLAPTPPPIGGIAIWTSRMMKAQLKNGWQVTVVDEKILGKREMFGDKTKRELLMEIKRCFRIWRELHREIKDPCAKVVHTCIPANTLPILREYVCACIAKWHKRKFIVHFRCTVPNMVKSRLNRFMLKRICNISDCVMLLNQQSVDYVAALTKTPIELIPNFVDGAEIADAHQIREKLTRVLYVGGVVETKGCLDLLKVAKQFPETEFRLVGKTEDKVSQAAMELPNVKLLGVMDREQLRQEYAQADVFAFLTYFAGEGFSNALAEAMAAGLPCLVTDWAANRDMIEDKGGFVVPIKSPSAAAQALQNMMPAEVRRAQSAFNIEKIKTVYADEAVLTQYVDCYESVLGK